MGYFQELSELIGSIDQDRLDQAIFTVKNARMVFVCGNGGSMATAVHFAGDLLKNAGVQASSLDNPTALTALANDEGYESVFWRQIQELCSPGEDVVVGISTSGNSLNVMNAVEFGIRVGLTTITLLGNDGGRMRGLGDIEFIVPPASIEQLEDAHMAICHAIIKGIKDQ